MDRPYPLLFGNYKDDRFKYKEIPNKFIYGENGLEHKWKLYKIKESDELLDYNGLNSLKTDYTVIDKFSV